MAVTRTQVSTGVAISAGTSLSDSWGSTTGSGASRLLLALIGFNTGASAPTITPPAGWTEILTTSSATANRVGAALYAIDAPSAGRSGAEAFTLSAARHATLALFEYQTDGDDIRIVEAHASRDDSGATTCRAPVAAGPAGSASLALVCTRQNATGDDANQSGQTNGYASVKELSSGTASVDALVGGYYELIAGIGEYVTQVTVGVGCYSCGINVVFSDDPVGVNAFGRGRKRRFRTRL